MSASIADLIAAKEAIVRVLIPPSLRSNVTKRRHQSRVAAAVATAGSNVHAVGVGPKIVNGIHVTDLCVRIYVVQKLPDSLIAPHYRLPSEIEGLPTDVIEAPPSVLYGRLKEERSGRPRLTRAKIKPAAVSVSSDTEPPGTLAIVNETVALGAEHGGVAGDTAADCSSPNARQRPIFGGLSGASVGILGGTLGCLCRSTKAGDEPTGLYVLSNSHVFDALEGPPSNDIVVQPSVGDGGGSGDRVASFARSAPVDLSPGGENKADAAIARLLPDVNARPGVCGIGTLGKPVDVANGERVQKFGQSTRLTSGIISDITHNAVLPFDGEAGSIYLVDQLLIEPVEERPFAGKGDSGSVVVRQDTHEVVGLLCGGDPYSGRWAIANKIGNVLQALSITLI